MSIKIRTNDEKTFIIDTTDVITLREFKVKICDETGIAVKEQRLLSAGKMICLDSDLEWLKQQPIPNVHVSQSKLTGNNSKPVHASVEKSVTLKKFETIWTLLLNCESCISAYDNNTPAEDRRRINAAEGLELRYPPNPSAQDLGVVTDRLATVYEHVGRIMTDCSEIIQTGSEDQLNKVQLMMDVNRYLSVLNQSMSCMVIPLGQTPPRFVSFRQNPVARRQPISN